MVIRPRWLLPVSFMILATATVLAQDADLTPHPADIRVQVVSASDPQTHVAAEKVMVRVQSALLDVVAEAGSVPSGEVTFGQVEVLNFKPYIVSAWVDGVAYHVRRSGQEFLDGKPAVVHAFELTDSPEGLDVRGMNAVVRRRATGFDYELILQVENLARPQRTMRADAMPLRVFLPDGLKGATVEVDNGPEPFAATLRPAGGMTGIVAPITPGQARITVKGQLETGRELEFVVGCNRPVDAWSLMTWPGDLQVDSFDLRQDRDKDYAGFGRWVGQALAPDQQVDVRVTAATATEAQAVFGDEPTTASRSTDSAPAERRGVPWLTIVAAVVLFGAYLVWRLRR